MNTRRESGTFKFEEDLFSKNVQCIGNIYHEVTLLVTFLQTKPQIKHMNINYYDLYYPVIKNRDDNESVTDENENDYIKYNDFFTPNRYIERKNDNEKLN